MADPTRQELAEAILYLSEKMNEKNLTNVVAAYLVHNRRSGDLDAVMRDVTYLREQRDNVTEVTATSAFKLDETARKNIKKVLGKDKLIINEVVDPEVLGGVRLETSELQLDLTVRNRLNQLKTATT